MCCDDSCLDLKSAAYPQAAHIRAEPQGAVFTASPVGMPSICLGWFTDNLTLPSIEEGQRPSVRIWAWRNAISYQTLVTS